MTIKRTITMSLFMLVMLFGLQACGGGGGGGSGTTTPAVNTSLATAARGFYEGSGTIQVAAGDLVIGSPDVKAIIDENEFNIIYKGTQILLYKGTFTEVTATTFKATVRVYKAGNFIATATIDNGTITAGTSFKGTIKATAAYTTTDYANSVGDIDLAYSASNSLTPTAYILNKSWQDSSPGTGNVTFTGATKADLVSAYNAVPAELQCSNTTIDTTNVVNEQTGRIRAFVTSALTSCTNSTIEGMQVHGYLTNFKVSATDDRMLVVLSDDNFAYIGILPCLNGVGACF